jgi:putative ABC transport system ATP-binding protein
MRPPGVGYAGALAMANTNRADFPGELPSAPEMPPPGAGDEPFVRARDLFKIYREGTAETVALRGASLDLRAGQVTSLVGRSGSGKSTLTLLIAGLALPSAGQVLLDGVDITRLDERERARLRARQVGIVFQRDNLIPFLTASENVALPIKLAGGQKAGARARDLLGELGLSKRLRHLPRQLSGGEVQRVAIAVALANEPKLLIGDELTGELDSKTAAQVLDVIGWAREKLRLTVLIVTHNPVVAAVAEQRLRLVDGEVQPA